MADETKPANPDDAVNRRQFFAKLGLGSLSIAAAGTAAFAYQFLEPNVLYEPSPVVNAGKPDQYPLHSVTLDVNSGIYIIHSQEGYFSLSAVCTHLGCLTAWKQELDRIACPCHGSQFAVWDATKSAGTVVAGPAPKPLPWKRIWLNDDGDLLVDRSTDVRPLQAESYVRV
ncbi:MAG TPA: Rieske 2Fe-2S domain-containing protein [Candidatus Sulfotelmatobacter sp.]|nr:Rieske 2Fe-2S domain-containing protein [Candidatus Sulfotelmatobacter sp.]